MDGEHDIDTCALVSERVWSEVTKALHECGVLLEGEASEFCNPFQSQFLLFPSSSFVKLSEICPVFSCCSCVSFHCLSLSSHC